MAAQRPWQTQWTDGCYHGIAGNGATGGPLNNNAWLCHPWGKQGWHFWRNGGPGWTVDECIEACEALGDCKMVYVSSSLGRYWRTGPDSVTAGPPHATACWPSRHRCATDEARVPYDYGTHVARGATQMYYLVDDGAPSVGGTEVSGWFEAPRTGTYLPRSFRTRAPSQPLCVLAACCLL